MWDCGPSQIDHAQILASTLGSLAHRIGDCVGFSDTHSDRALLITDDHSHAELEAASAFDDFRDAGDFDHAFFVRILLLEILLFSILFEFCHVLLHFGLELQAAFPCTVCESLHTANVTETAAIEYNCINTF